MHKQYCKNDHTSKTDKKFSIISIKILTVFLTEILKIILKFIRNKKRFRIPKAILGNQRKPGDITIPDFKSYCKVFGYLIFDKEAKNIQQKKVSLTNVAGKIDGPHSKD